MSTLDQHLAKLYSKIAKDPDNQVTGRGGEMMAMYDPHTMMPMAAGTLVGGLPVGGLMSAGTLVGGKTRRKGCRICVQRKKYHSDKLDKDVERCAKFSRLYKKKGCMTENPWVAFLKKFSARKGITYAEALRSPVASALYRSIKESRNI